MNKIELSTVIFLLLFMNCNQPKTIDIQGHRGCRGLMPENTLQAFEKAIELGVHTMELDVAVSKDNIVVVSHEPYMNPVICKDPNGNEINTKDALDHNLYKMSFDSIKQYDCGTKINPKYPDQKKIKAFKPALDEVFKSAKNLNSEIKFNIELKARPEFDGIYTPNPKEFVELVLQVVKDNDAFNETNLQSFDLRILEEVKLQSPTMKVALLVDARESITDKLKYLSYKPEIISPYFKLLDIKNIEKYREDGFKIIPWTVNSVEDMKQMIDFQVDGIITDYPDRLIQLLK